MSHSEIVTVVPKESWKPVRQFKIEPSCGSCHPCAGAEDESLCFALPSCFEPVPGWSEQCRVFVEVK